MHVRPPDNRGESAEAPPLPRFPPPPPLSSLLPPPPPPGEGTAAPPGVTRTPKFAWTATLRLTDQQSWRFGAGEKDAAVAAWAAANKGERSGDAPICPEAS